MNIYKSLQVERQTLKFIKKSLHSRQLLFHTATDAMDVIPTDIVASDARNRVKEGQIQVEEEIEDKERPIKKLQRLLYEHREVN